jgi:hypothetical protein
MTKASDAFEQQVHRVYELLVDSGAKVTWSDHVPDPDNPNQQRQIDVTIRRDGKLTHVECRKHKCRQDVKWIEELIGRRTSLRADAVIAVSSSGFTAGALRKAKSHGVIPRDLCQLTDTEIKNWGRRMALTLFFYQYSNLEVSLLFDPGSIPRLDTEVVKSELRLHPAMQSLFNAAAQQLDGLNLLKDASAGTQPDRTVEFKLRLQFDDLRVCGELVIEVTFHGRARLISKSVKSPAVLAYGDPEENFVRREATIESFSLGETSIVHDADRISVLLDISQVKMPPFCQFRFFNLSGEEEMNHEALELYGCDKLGVAGKRMKVKICSQRFLPTP